MKHISLIIGLIILALTIGACLLFEAIGTPTLIVSSSVVFSTTILSFISGISNLKTAFKVSVPFFLAFNGIVEYVLSFFLGETVKNDGYFIAILALFAMQIIVLVITSSVSRLNNER